MVIWKKSEARSDLSSYLNITDAEIKVCRQFYWYPFIHCKKKKSPEKRIALYSIHQSTENGRTANRITSRWLSEKRKKDFRLVEKAVPCGRGNQAQGQASSGYKWGIYTKKSGYSAFLKIFRNKSRSVKKQEIMLTIIGRTQTTKKGKIKMKKQGRLQLKVQRMSWAIWRKNWAIRAEQDIFGRMTEISALDSATWLVKQPVDRPVTCLTDSLPILWAEN